MIKSFQIEDSIAYLGDAFDTLRGLEDESVNCVVTSPPYWKLRDYGANGQIGQEKNFEEYIENILCVLDEVKRVLRVDGTCFVNIGDTYAVSKNKGVPAKSLNCIPDRFKIEMVNRGWICRNEIIWHKPNAMPSSSKDRFTVDYEKVFFFVKNKKYQFKQLFEPLSEVSLKDYYGRKTFRNKGSNNVYGCPGEGRDRREFYNIDTGRNKRCVWSINTKPFPEAHFAVFPESLINPMIESGCPENGVILDPFFGSGTVGVVAIKQNKKFIGIELNQDYIEIAKERISKIYNEKQARIFKEVSV